MTKRVHANLAELSAAICCEFEDNPIALAMLGTKEVFLCAAPYGAHHYRSAAHSPFLQELLRANRVALRKSVIFLARKIIESAFTHFPKSVVFGRAI